MPYKKKGKAVSSKLSSKIVKTGANPSSKQRSQDGGPSNESKQMAKGSDTGKSPKKIVGYMEKINPKEVKKGKEQKGIGSSHKDSDNWDITRAVVPDGKGKMAIKVT